jgi:serine/threonine protein phosphatase PrpC
MVDGPGYAARSDVGRTRTDNEDRFLAKPPLFAVADGMGGHQAGEVASGIAIELLDAIAGRMPPPSEPEIVDAIERSNGAIRDEARSRADLAGMGTTCTVVVIDAAIHVAHVGDSRAYRLSDGRLVQLTDDHSLVASMVRDGVISSEEALVDGRRNIITRALGAEDEVHVDVISADRRPGDRILVCSDGLHGQVDDAAIAAVLRDEKDPRVAADRLVSLANAAGGDDNVTVIVIDPDALVEVAEDPPSNAGRRRTAFVLILLSLIVIVVAIVAWLSTAPALAAG